MPPKPSITKEQILDAAFDIVRLEGVNQLTARSIAHKLRCSTQPVYRIYASMDEVKNLVYDKAVALMRRHIFDYREEGNSPALNMAIGFLHFAAREPMIFQLVYLSGIRTYDISQDVFVGETLAMEPMLQSQRFQALEEQQQRDIFIKISIYLIGAGTMIQSGTLRMGLAEAVASVREIYEALIAYEGGRSI